ncbi:hypothetical protein Rhe02_04900 [Rhizocola hellebori]|uniref:DUF916 domain-containing protein n=1 Tax=Rhizocola hellebori TaxID=1392758 RepID=A0A8J3Q2X7_9ACTN|nr:DUF916 domain-containing protein [Rhizocola hellebori]GIH02423.1 hypothetical protein Rhe02_04900 [Rhizocola hellebori]
MRRIIVTVVLSLAAFAWAPPGAQATGNGDWAVNPTPPADPGPAPRRYFFLESPAGQAIVDSVRISNLSDRELSFKVYPADAYNTERDGGFGLRTADERQTGIGAWTTAPVSNLVVRARTQVDIPFTINIPANATPGDHVGGLVAVESTPSSQTSQGGSTVAVLRAVGARIYLRVAGLAAPSLAIQDLDLGRRGTLAYTLANTGNVHLAPTLSAKATGLFGHRIGQQGEFPSPDLVPGAHSTLSTTLTGLWPLDFVTTTVTASAEGSVLTTASTHNLVVSWPVLTALLLLGAGLAYYLWRRNRTRRRKPRAAL